jgi:DNA-binding NarL/FixJ family response regulator
MNEPAVLIVDDEKNIRLTLSMALESLKISVAAAGAGEEALQKLAEKAFRLIALGRPPGGTGAGGGWPALTGQPGGADREETTQLSETNRPGQTCSARSI